MTRCYSPELGAKAWRLLDLRREASLDRADPGRRAPLFVAATTRQIRDLERELQAAATEAGGCIEAPLCGGVGLVVRRDTPHTGGLRG